MGDTHAQTGSSTRLVVFSDDWGRHPSSCQHLVGQLLDRYPVLWVNTVGTRTPKLSMEDMGKALTKLRQWSRPAGAMGGEAVKLPANLSLVTPPMYPGFRRGWQRRWNAKSIAKHIHGALGERKPGERRVAITTLPITADVIGRLDVDAWIYYCVDDFSVWPGLDGSVMDTLEREQAGTVDAALAVSDTLIARLAGMKCEASLMTHGIDMEHWQQTGAMTIDDAALPSWWPTGDEPVLLFWGVVDTRLDVDWCRELARLGRLVLLGPQQSPDAAVRALPGVIMPGPAAYADLPRFAAAADVLVMPYADLPVTRAMQPLKFKEYLATGRPAVVRNLPSTVAWRDAADVLSDALQLSGVIPQRVAEGVPTEQLTARAPLASESWRAKADVLASTIDRVAR